MSKEKKTLDKTHPNLCKQWHPTKNILKPSDVTSGSNKKVWWYLPYDDPETGHHDFEWQASINNRTKAQSGCPYLTGNGVWVGFNDLATIDPELSAEWHPTKNGKLTPTDVTYGAKRKIWWLLSYDDPNTGKRFDFEWQASVCDRRRGRGCPYITNKKLFKGFNDLATCFPYLAKEWHPTKNGTLKPEDVLFGSHQKVWWKMQYCDSELDENFELEWMAAISDRTFRGDGCPYLSGHAILPGFNDLKTRFPEIAKQWHPTKNGTLKPEDILYGSKQKVWWLMDYFDTNSNDFMKLEWEASVDNRVRQGSGCPYLSTSNGRPIVGVNDLKTTHPHLAGQWHPIKNGNLLPEYMKAGSSKKVWWQIQDGDSTYEWMASIANRTLRGSGCPQLSGSYLEIKTCSILNKNNIEFIKEKIIDSCRTKKNRHYRFDLFLKQFNLIIEIDGNQHFKVVDKFGGEMAFQNQVYSDNYKNMYAFQTHTPILRIPYCYLNNDGLERIILSFVQTKIIPQEILDFYSQFEFSNYVQCVEKYHASIKEAEIT